MTTIHMDTEITRQLAGKFREVADKFQNSYSSLNSAVDNIEWTGGTSDDFRSRMKSVVSKLCSNYDLTMDSIRLIDEIEQWITIDQNAVETFKSNQTKWQLFAASLGISFTQLPSMWRALINSYSLDEVWGYLQGTPSGKALEDLAREHSTCFVFPDGTIVGDPDAVIKYTVNFGDTPEGVNGAHNRYDLTITISDDLLHSDKVTLAGILGHEMQHAVDAVQGKMPLYPKISGNESEAELETMMADWIDGRVHSEVRSYERQENIALGTEYVDDGILTKSERINFFKNHSSYKPGYEENIAGILPGYTAAISVDPTTGELVVDLQPIAQPLSEFAYTA
jgi:uncharacterized protein YukE